MPNKFARQRPLPAKPDPVAMRALQARYAVLAGPGRGHGGKRAWTVAHAVQLGRLYVAAWGHVPRTTHMDASWCLPGTGAILGLFGSYASFYAALEAD